MQLLDLDESTGIWPEDVRVRHLFAHVTRLRRRDRRPGALRRGRRRARRRGRGAAVGRAARPAARPPGRTPTPGYWLAGWLAAQQNGSTYEEALQEHVLGPAGLTDATFGEPSLAGNGPGADGGDYPGLGAPRAGSSRPPQTSAASPTGSCRSLDERDARTAGEADRAASTGSASSASGSPAPTSGATRLLRRLPVSLLLVPSRDAWFVGLTNSEPRRPGSARDRGRLVRGAARRAAPVAPTVALDPGRSPASAAATRTRTSTARSRRAAKGCSSGDQTEELEATAASDRADDVRDRRRRRRSAPLRLPARRFRALRQPARAAASRDRERSPPVTPRPPRPGVEILAAGGNAADAAVAASLASCVAETVMTGLLGGGHAIYLDAATGQARNLDCFVAVPSGARRADETARGAVRRGARALRDRRLVVRGARRSRRARRAVAGARPTAVGARSSSRRCGSRERRRDAGRARRVSRDARAGDDDARGRSASTHRRQLLAAGDLLDQPGLVAALELLRDEGAASVYSGLDRGGAARAHRRPATVAHRGRSRRLPRRRGRQPVETRFAGTRVLTRGGLAGVAETLAGFRPRGRPAPSRRLARGARRRRPRRQPHDEPDVVDRDGQRLRADDEPRASAPATGCRDSTCT